MAVRMKRTVNGTEAAAVMAERKMPVRSEAESVAGSQADAETNEPAEHGRLAKPQRQHRIARLLEQHSGLMAWWPPKPPSAVT
jgi:hypothetical protein